MDSIKQIGLGRVDREIGIERLLTRDVEVRVEAKERGRGRLSIFRMPVP